MMMVWFSLHHTSPKYLNNADIRRYYLTGILDVCLVPDGGEGVVRRGEGDAEHQEQEVRHLGGTIIIIIIMECLKKGD